MTVPKSKMEKVTNDLYYFYRYFIASNYPNSVPAPHIKKLVQDGIAAKNKGYTKPTVTLNSSSNTL